MISITLFVSRARRSQRCARATHPHAHPLTHALTHPVPPSLLLLVYFFACPNLLGITIPVGWALNTNNQPTACPRYSRAWCGTHPSVCSQNQEIQEIGQSEPLCLEPLIHSFPHSLFLSASLSIHHLALLHVRECGIVFIPLFTPQNQEIQEMGKDMGQSEPLCLETTHSLLSSLSLSVCLFVNPLSRIAPCERVRYSLHPSVHSPEPGDSGDGQERAAVSETTHSFLSSLSLLSASVNPPSRTTPCERVWYSLHPSVHSAEPGDPGDGQERAAVSETTHPLLSTLSPSVCLFVNPPSRTTPCERMRYSLHPSVHSPEPGDRPERAAV